MPDTSLGFPYPGPLEPVAEGAAAIEALAVEVNDTVGRHAAGTVTGLTLGASGSTSQAVTFPAGRFTAPPVVTCNITTGYPAAGTVQNAFAWASAVTASGCTINYRRSAADTGTVVWHAVQV